MKQWSALAALLLAFVAALALRLPQLSARPLHNDEAVNATKVGELLDTGRYKYDPDEYHGPTLHYATLPFLWLTGADKSGAVKDYALRLAPVFFGSALIFLLLLFKVALDRQALFWSALFIAISPAMVFYSRYFIHEMLLVFFTTLMIGAGWRYAQRKEAIWAGVTGASIGLMYATKETFVLTMAAVVAALGFTWWRSPRREAKAALPTRHLATGLAAFVLVWATLFTSFFSNWAGLADSIQTYLPWLKRAGGHSPHIHPWYFYLERLVWFHPAKSPVWSEAFIVGLAIVGAVVSFRDKCRFGIFITIYTVVLTAIYCVISYKTPWCLLNFFVGMILLAGVGASAVVHFFKSAPAKIFATAILLGLAAQLTFQAHRANVTFAADRRNPYVYAQTTPDLLNLVEKANGIAAVAPNGFDSVVKVITPGGDYWPLPWYLRGFQNVGWYEQMPDDPYAPLVICAQQLDARLDEKSEKKWIMVGYTELRPQKFLELYVELELWKKYVASLPPPTE